MNEHHDSPTTKLRLSKIQGGWLQIEVLRLRLNLLANTFLR